MSMEPVNPWEPDEAPTERPRLRRVSKPLPPPPSSIPANYNAPGPLGAREPPPSPTLEFFTIRRLIKEVEEAGPRKWLLREIWPSGDYGVLAGEMKTQKTWCAIDMAISVASGTPWLGHVPVDDPGPVLMFCGEGGKANILARLRAIAETREVSLAKLDIVVCPRAPHLSDKNHVDQVADALAEVRPKLVVVDPPCTLRQEGRMEPTCTPWEASWKESSTGVRMSLRLWRSFTTSIASREKGRCAWPAPDQRSGGGC